MKVDNALLLRIHKILSRHFGPLHWWPGESPFEVIVGAILTQSTSWKNVEKAIGNLKDKSLLNSNAMRRVKMQKLARLIRPAGYFNVKARRIKGFVEFLFLKYGGRLSRMSKVKGSLLRQELMGVNGIGPETADSILLYAAKKPFFVIDAYTRRIFSRHHFFSEAAGYNQIQQFFTDRLPTRTALFNEYHAQLVEIGKRYCKRSQPVCSHCPMAFLFDLE